MTTACMSSLKHHEAFDDHRIQKDTIDSLGDVPGDGGKDKNIVYHIFLMSYHKVPATNVSGRVSHSF